MDPVVSYSHVVRVPHRHTPNSQVSPATAQVTDAQRSINKIKKSQSCIPNSDLNTGDHSVFFHYDSIPIVVVATVVVVVSLSPVCEKRCKSHQNSLDSVIN